MPLFSKRFPLSFALRILHFSGLVIRLGWDNPFTKIKANKN
jgi:hypothetical protein